MSDGRALFGRATIYTTKTEITKDNVVQVLNDSLDIHSTNQKEIDYLYEYWRGKQPILERAKTVRPEIDNKVVVNRANEIVAFKVGYVFGEPIQYVSRKEASNESISSLNDIMFELDKEAEDKELAEWFSICGVGYRMVLPNKNMDDLNPSPIFICVLDPRYCFVVRSFELDKPVVMGVKIIKKTKDTNLYSIYTKDRYFEVENNQVIKDEPHSLGAVPIIEYCTSKSKLGEFEKVIDLLDAINLTISDRVNGIEQFVQSLMKFINADISADDFEKLKDLGAIKIRSENGNPADVEYMSHELNQSQVQIAIDDMYQTVLTICGMPNRNGGSSTSDTGSAVALRDGWESAEARAKDIEVVFKRSEKQFLRLALRIMKDMNSLNAQARDVEIKFTRRNYENITEKSNVLVSMLNCDKIHPRLAFQHCGMFNDIDSAYKMSEEYANEQAAKQQRNTIQQGGKNNGGNGEIIEDDTE